MSTQFVDMNADGHMDILAGSFSGSPYLIEGSKEGYLDPKPVLDINGDVVLLAAFWNYEEEKWDETDRSGTKGHCTSASAVDWDDDGDLDLLLGCYRSGKLHLRVNEGTAKEPKFAVENIVIEAEGKPMVTDGGIAAPRIVDWDGDGLFDILCGGAKGNVCYFRNVGKKGEPEFASAEVLLEIKFEGGNRNMVPAVDGLPSLPGSSYHIEPVDYDSDGDLDLLVGARATWKGAVEELSEEEQKEADEIQGKMPEIQKKLSEIRKAFDEDGEGDLRDFEPYVEFMKENRETMNKNRAYMSRKNPIQNGDFVWLFRRD